jgi:NCS2 family nucleobase:cation symporter-2
VYVVAVGLGVGMIPLLADRFFDALPRALSPLLHSGILLASVVAVLLNLYFNGVSPYEISGRE